MNPISPSLFGITRSNRDFTKQDTWGKNQFNSSFPAALACYMHSKKMHPIYLELNSDLRISHSYIEVDRLFGIDPLNDKTFFSFETEYSPYLTLVSDNLPRIDLVICKSMNSSIECLNGLEVKLTALPDEQTYELSEDRYGCEIVVRPDTIVYLALSIVSSPSQTQDSLKELIAPACDAIDDWSSHVGMLPNMGKIYDCLEEVLLSVIQEQKPLLIQPIWKTKGKSSVLADNCLDMFVWSNLAFTRLFMDMARHSGTAKITRHARTAIWLMKMISNYCETGKIGHKNVIDLFTYDTKNDKAFSVPGNITHSYMTSDILKNPRISKKDIKNIILGGGEKMLSPERRFDAAILTSPEIFL